MSTLSAVVLTGAIAVVGGVTGYQYVSGADTKATAAVHAPAVKHRHVRVVGKPVVHVKIRPCRKGFTRKGQQCVRQVQRTVVVNVPAPAPPQPAVTSPSTAPQTQAPVRSERPARPHVYGGQHSDGGGRHSGGEHEHSSPAPGGGGGGSGEVHGSPGGDD